MYALGFVLELLISTAGGRFHFITVQGRHLFKETTFTVSTLPRAWLEPPCASHYGVSRLMGLHYRSSHRRPFAIPANVFGGASSAQSQDKEDCDSVTSYEEN